MPENEQEKFTLYDFRVEKWEDIISSLGEMMEAKEKLLDLGLPIIDKVLTRVSFIYSSAKNFKANNFVDVIDKETTRFLTNDVIQYVLDNPDDTPIVGLLSSQLFIISSATGNLPESEAKPYNLEEFKEVILGTASFYNETVFLQTLRQMILSVEEDERFLWLLNSLSPLRIEDESSQYNWDEALMFSVVLQTVWRNFALFGQQSQQFLLQNYFYQAIVCGVPVRYWLDQFFGAIDDQKIADQVCGMFVKALESNQEKALVNLYKMTERPLSGIIKDYTTRIYSSQEKIDVFTQEKFIEEIYVGQEGSENFADWMRQTLGIVLKLRKKDWS
jgi:hypothetical protein